MDRLQPCWALMGDIEREMRQLGLWEQQPPAHEAFLSVLPFSIDTLRFTQWLQWVFIPRTRALVEQGGPLPTKSAIVPLAAEIFRELPEDTERLLILIERFDRLVGGGD